MNTSVHHWLVHLKYYISTLAHLHICTFQWALQYTSTSAHFSELISTSVLCRLWAYHALCWCHEIGIVLTDFIIKYHEHINILWWFLLSQKAKDWPFLKSSNFTIDVYYLLSIEFEHAKRNSTLFIRNFFKLITPSTPLSSSSSPSDELNKLCCKDEKWTKQMLSASLNFNDDSYFFDAWCMVMFLCV